ncbi:MAG: formylglycine-generating enzyme family protein [Chitinophagales bacterium]
MNRNLPTWSNPQMLLIPEGNFLMGSDNGAANERPIHQVWVDAFEIAKYPVTNKEYAVFLELTAYKTPPFWNAPKFSHPDQPVVGINWYDANAYCKWLSDRLGRNFRLPTEAEREKAARGGLKASEYPWGNELPENHLGGRNAELDSIGVEVPNGFGLYNMSAGVHEWCSDFYDASYYEVSEYRNPKGAESGHRYSSRGGSWRHRIRFSRCAARSSVPADKQYNDFGFRCAATL